MSFDKHSLEAYSTIASVTGTNPNLSIVVQTGDGAKFGNPQNVTIWPVGDQPTLANSTIGRISGISTDTLTVTTAQEGSSNITVAAGYQIANTITPKVLTDVEAYTNPTGVIQMWGGSVAPTDWLLCNGSAVSRTTYATLYGVIGTTYGAGDGSTTFNLPNFQGNVPVGYKSGDTNFGALGDTGGEETHTLTIAEMPNHGHNPAEGAFVYNVYPNSTSYEFTPGGGNLDPNHGGSTANSGGGGAHNNLQPFLVVNYIIKT